MRPADLEFGFQRGQRETGILKIEHRLAESLAVLGEFHRFIERPLRAGLRRNRDAEPFLRQLAHQIDEALVFLAQAIGHRHAHIVEEQFRCVGAVLADLVEVAAARKPFGAGFDQNQRGALGALVGVGFGDNDDQVGVLAVGDIGFGTRDDIVIAILFRGRADTLEIGAGARLGHRDGGDQFARNHLGQIFLLLFLAAIGNDVIGNDIGLQRDTGRRSGIGEFFIDHGIIAEIQPQPAIFLGHGRA